MLPHPDHQYTVFILDDHDIVRRGLLDLLSSKRDIRVFGDSGSAYVAVNAILTLKPDVMLLDLQLQDGTGVSVCRAVRAENPDIRGLLLTAAPDVDAMDAMVLAGASGHVVKLAHSFDIADAVRAVGAGRRLVDAAALGAATERIVRRANGDAGLSDSERELVGFLVEGLTDREIAERREVALSAIRPTIDAVTGHLLNGLS